MHLIPPYPVDEWTAVEGTRTTWAEPIVSGSVSDEEIGAPAWWLAYAVTPENRTSPIAVRLDFTGIVHYQYSSSRVRGWTFEPRGTSEQSYRPMLMVCDRSPLLDSLLGDVSPVHGGIATDPVVPEPPLRHFAVSCGEYGRYEIVAEDCVVRTFEFAPVPQGQLATRRPQARDQERADLLAAASRLGVPPR